jgi:hypothetical protein
MLSGPLSRSLGYAWLEPWGASAGGALCAPGSRWWRSWRTRTVMATTRDVRPLMTPVTAAGDHMAPYSTDALMTLVAKSCSTS